VKESVAGQVSGAANALRRTAGSMREEGNESLAGYAERAAGRLDSFGNTVREGRVGDLVESVERFARREPVLFFGGTLLVGLLAARFLKSSSERRHAEERSRWEGPSPGEERAGWDEGSRQQEGLPMTAPAWQATGQVEPTFDEPFEPSDTSAVDRDLEGRV
jgi:hypothetical protein